MGCVLIDKEYALALLNYPIAAEKLAYDVVMRLAEFSLLRLFF